MGRYAVRVLAIYEQTIYITAPNAEVARAVYEEGGGAYDAEIEFIEELPEENGGRVTVTEVGPHEGPPGWDDMTEQDA